MRPRSFEDFSLPCGNPRWPGKILKAYGGFDIKGASMDVTDKQIMEIAQHAFTRMDGARFLALAKKFGIQTA